MDWVEAEALGHFRPLFADGLIGFDALQRLEPPSAILGVDEVGEVRATLIVSLVVEAFDGGFFDRAVHAFELAVGAGMLRLGQLVDDIVPGALVSDSVRPEEFAGHDSLFDDEHC